MKNYYILLVSLFILISDLYSQSPNWHVLPTSPFTLWRHDDLSFINANTGWVIFDTQFSSANTGRVYNTTDGGASWNMQMEVNHVYLRCISFTDSLHGFIGTLGNYQGMSPSPILFKTTNGGVTWDSVTFVSNRPGGLCGMSTVNGGYVFAAGRIDGPPYFIKSTDGGITWISRNMNAYSSHLVDCKFFTPDSGFVVGAIDTPITQNGKSLILFTSDGGNTWIERYRGNHPYDGCWKISFPSRNTGYVSLDTYEDTLFVIKTTNGGVSWQKINLYTGTQPVGTQGIGFINDNTGWVGGDPNVPGITFKTTNGGINWQFDNFGSHLNRIRFINDSLGYAAGTRIYKFTNIPIGIQPISTEIPKQFSLEQNYPNPFNPETKIRFEIPPFAKGGPGGFIQLKIYNALGQEITTLANEQLKAGIYEINWNASDYPSGIYFYELKTENISETKKLVLLK